MNRSGTGMNFSFHPSLEHITLVNIGSRLWNQQKIGNLIQVFCKSKSFLKAGNNPLFFHDHTKKKDDWSNIEEKVMESAAKLVMPMPLQRKISGYIPLMGLKILEWLEYHLKFLYFNHLAVPREFLFTPQGTIDKKKTIELLIRNDSLNVSERFKLASMYCLKNDIQQLWNDMSNIEKEKFNVDELSPLVTIMLGDFGVFWAFYLRGEMNKMNDLVNKSSDIECPYEYLLAYAAKIGNKAATEFVLKKINSSRLTLLLKKIATCIIDQFDQRCGLSDPPPKEYFVEVLCCLISQACHEDQIEILTLHPLKVVNSFLDWPWQNLLLRVVRYMWNFLPEKLYYSILGCITFKIRYDVKDYNYQQMFFDVWQEIPDSHKSFILNDDHITELVDIFLMKKDKDMIKLIFQDANIIDKNKVIFSYDGLNCCTKLIYYNKMDILLYFIQLLISSKEEMIKFKQEIEKHIKGKKHLSPDNNFQMRCKEFSQILDRVIVNFRSSYDENISNKKNVERN